MTESPLMDPLRSLAVRRGYEIFPRWTSGVWTWLTGKALPGQRPLIDPGPWGYLATALVPLAAGSALSAWAVLAPSRWSLPAIVLGWMLALNGARKMALTCAHQCAHARFTGDKRLDRAVNQAITILLFTQDAMTYHHDHTEVHHGAKTFATRTDPVLSFIEQQGFHPGMPARTLWRRMWLTLVSPRFHLSYFWSRTRHNIIVPSGWRRAAGLLYAAAWVAFALLVHDGWKVALVSFAVPIVFLYQIAAFLELLCEHDWLRPDEPGLPARMRRATHSWARFCGAPVPRSGGAAAWARWTAAMLFFHLPMRLFVLTGDAPQHDYHHRFVSTTEWTVAAYARQRDIDGGHPGQPPYSEFWGLHTALAYVFEQLSRRRASEIRHDPLTGRLVLADTMPVAPGLPEPVPARSA